MTDDEYLAKIRRSHKRCRIWGAVLLITGVLWAGGMWWCGHSLSQRSLNMFSNFEEPTADQLAEDVDNTRFFVGLVLGFILGLGFSGSVILASWGFCLLVAGPQDRKTQLLLKYADAHKKGDVLTDRSP